VTQSFAEANSIAEAFVRARRNADALADYPGVEPTDLQSALAIQDAAISMLGEPVAGWKVGRINPPWEERLGTNRLPGPIFASRVQNARNGKAPMGQIFCNGFGAAEAEFIFRLGRGLKPGTSTLSLSETADLVDAVFVGIEVASSPFPGINVRGPLVTISDFGNNNGLILGAEIPDWRNSGLEDWKIAARIDDQIVGEGCASAFPDGPVGSVRFLIENLVSRGIAIEPGLLISTGAVSGVHEISDGQKFEAQFGDFAKIECEIGFAVA
jgi:2-keto-4-pentenoate hydratase